MNPLFGIGGAPAGQVFLISSTVTGNANRSNFGAGGGLHAVNGGTITLRNSIVSGNTATAGGGEIQDVTGGALIISQGGNLIGHSGAANTAGFTPGPNDLVPAGALDTILNTTLAENGGPALTVTHALVTGSPAIDFVPTANCTVATDQRGVDRPKGSSCDAGAYEFGTDSVDLGITKTGPVSAKVGDTLTYRLVVVNNGPDDASEVRVNDRMPDSLQAVSATSSQGNCAIDPHVGRGSIAVFCLLGDLPNGADAEIVIEAVALQTGLIENQGQVTVPINVQDDRDPFNNNDSAFTQVDPAGPVYAATVQQPIDADGGSTFNAKKGVVPVKFTLTADGAGTCTLPPATIALTRTGGTVDLGPISEGTFSGAADSGSSFRITDCQYHYNLNVKSLKAGEYQVDILIDGNLVGSATFGMR